MMIYSIKMGYTMYIWKSARREVSRLLNLTAYERYNTLFNALKQLPPVAPPGYANLAGAYMTAKYGRPMNTALSSSLSGIMKSIRTDATALSQQTKDLTARSTRSGLTAADGSAAGVTAQKALAGGSLQIDQLAARQINQGSLVRSAQTSALTPGKQTLSVETGGKSYTFSITTRTGETNGSVLEKTAAGINGLGAGLKARVASDTLGNSQLVVESAKAGTENSFSFSGSLADSMGLNQVTQAPANARFTYNGTAYETQDNQVTLDNGKTTLELRKTTDAPVTLRRTLDTQGLREDVEKLADAYNQLQETLKASPDNKALQAVSRQLNQLVSGRAAELSRFGVTRDAQGSLKVDAERLQAELETRPEEASRLFVDRGSLSDQLQSRSAQLLSSPAGSLIGSAVPPSAAPYQRINSSVVSQLSSTQSTGNLFDLFL